MVVSFAHNHCQRAVLMNSTTLSNIKANNNIKSLNLNFGPNHPAAHGVLRLSLQMDGEIIKKSDVHIGLLHRGTEKLMETKIYLLSLPYFDRLDYVSMMSQEHAYCLAVEKLQNSTNFNQKIMKVRTIFDELTRILNHLLAIACHALDVGSMSPLFWAFEERENIMELYENVSGARMHAAYYRPGGISTNLTENVILKILEFSNTCQKTVNSINESLTENKIWKQRLLGVGTYGYKEAINYGLTGVMARCTGLKRDVRFNKRTTYGTYFFSNNKSYVSNNGDSLDRYLLRIQEMSESLSIITKNVSSSKIFYKNPIDLYSRNLWLNFTNKKNDTTEQVSMEDMINHFKKWSEGVVINNGITTQYVESPKGEFGVTLLADGTNRPNRCKIRSPAYNHIQFLPKLIKNLQIADLITSIGTIDIVFGEIDR